jgi:hypothetical protein
MGDAEKINNVKMHYKSIANGTTQPFGYDTFVKGKITRPTLTVASYAPIEPENTKLWTVVNNNVRKSKWKKYYDEEDKPNERSRGDKPSRRGREFSRQ